MASRLRFERRSAVLETVILPLNYRDIWRLSEGSIPITLSTLCFQGKFEGRLSVKQTNGSLGKNRTLITGLEGRGSFP